MNEPIKKVIKYELINIFRNRWVFVYTILVAAMTFSLQKISGDFQKTILSLSGISVVFVPLVASFFTALYWYYSDRFTHLMLTQPMPRHVLIISRFIALTVSLASCMGLGLMLGFLFLGQWGWDLFLLIGINVMLTFIFVALSLWISIAIEDRMKGVGLVFGVWLYFVLVHDGFILLVLLTLKDYPMDLPGAFLGILSPIGLGRVVLLMHNEGSMLLGHTGALIREIMTSWKGYTVAIVISIFWMTLPFTFAFKAFQRKDF